MHDLSIRKFKTSQIRNEYVYTLFVDIFLVEVALKRGVVHVVAQFHSQTLYDVKHDVCKVDAKTFGCPMLKGNIRITIIVKFFYLEINCTHYQYS